MLVDWALLTVMSLNKPRTPGREERLSSSQQKLNLSAVQKIDADASEVKRTASNVVLYKYDGVANEWERSSTEGPFFVYKRKSKPFYGFAILNRLNSENFKEHLLPDMELRNQLSFVLFKKKTEQIFGLCFPDESSAQEIGTFLIQMASLSLPNQSDKPEVSALRSASAPYSSYSQTTAQPENGSVESIQPVGLFTLRTSLELGHINTDSSSPAGVSAQSSSGTPVKKTEQNKQSMQLSKQKPHQPTPSSTAVNVPVTSAPVQMVPSTPYTAPILPHDVPEKAASVSQPVKFIQSLPASTTGLISPGGFSSKKTETSGAIFTPVGGENRIQSVGGENRIQSLFSSIEPKSGAANVPLGAFSLAEVENKLQIDQSVQVPFGSPITPSPNLTSGVQLGSSHVLIQPSIYATSSSVGVMDTLQNASPERSSSFADKTKDPVLHLPDLKPNTFPSIPPLMHSAGMKASPMTGVLKDKEPLLQFNKNLMPEVPLLTKTELQKTLLHLIEHDEAFLNSIHTAYLQTHPRNLM